jgi:tellurite methyltransferase
VSDASTDRGGPSRFFESHLEALAATRSLGPLLDLACGRGRHAAFAAARGLHVIALDRRPEFLENLLKMKVEEPGKIEVLEVDLEASGVRAPLASGRYGAIVVSRYLHRPLMPELESALCPGGLLLYETFTVAQRDLGWGPRRSDFLLEAGELPTLCPSLETIVYEEGASADDPPAITARWLARRPR